MDSALRCPYKPFKLGLGGKQVTRYTREKRYGILSCLSIIIIIIIKTTTLSSMAFGILLNQEMNIMNISYICAQINEIVETVLPLQKSSVALHDSLQRHAYTRTHPNSDFMGFTHKAFGVTWQHL